MCRMEKKGKGGGRTQTTIKNNTHDMHSEKVLIERKRISTEGKRQKNFSQPVAREGKKHDTCRGKKRGKCTTEQHNAGGAPS